jgi:hypothetical protein
MAEENDNGCNAVDVVCLAAQLLDPTDEEYEPDCDDLLVLAFSFHPKYLCSENVDEDLTFRNILQLLAAYAPEYTIQHFPAIVKFGHWRDLNNLVQDNWKTINAKSPELVPNATRIHSAMVEFMGNQLEKDAAIIVKEVTDLSGEEGEGQDITALSLLAQHVPRIRCSLDKHTHFARDIALWLRPATNDKEKLTAYVGYRKLYRSICVVLENTSPYHQNYNKGREAELMSRLNVEERVRVLQMPPNTFVKTPEELSVASCPLEDLTPLISQLRTNAPVPNANVEISLGTIVPVKTATGSIAEGTVSTLSDDIHLPRQYILRRRISILYIILALLVTLNLVIADFRHP